MLHATTVDHFSHARSRNHLRIMSNEHDRPDTIAAPPMQERDTQPPGEDDAEATRVGTMVPPKIPIQLDAEGLVVNPQDMPSLLYNQLMKVHAQQGKRDADLFEPDGKFAALQRQLRAETVGEFKEAVAPRFKGLEDTVASLQRAVDELRAKMTEERKAFDAKFAEQEENLAQINQVIDDIQKQRAERDAAQPPPAPAA